MRTYIAVLVLALLLLPERAQADEIDKAKGLLHTERHAEGVARIRKAITALEKKRQDADAVRRAGVGYFFLEEDAKARLAFAKAIQLAPRNSKAHYWMGVLLQYEDLEAAEKIMAKAVSLAPGKPFYLFELADLQRLGEKKAAAIETYCKALALDETNAVGHMRLGNLLIGTGERKAVVKHLERATDLDDTLVLAHYNVAQVHYDAGRFAKSLAHWRAGVKLEPGDFGMHKKVIQALYALGRYAEAKPVRARLIEIRKALEDKPAAYCFDQFRVAKLRILAYERFDTTGDLVYLYVFKVVGEDGKITHKVNLETDAMMREMGGGWVLGMTENDGTHHTLSPMWRKLPPYPELKKQVILAAQRKLAPQASSRSGQGR